MVNNRITKQLSYRELKTGEREQARKKGKDNLKDNDNALHMRLTHWEELALNYTKWKHF